MSNTPFSSSGRYAAALAQPAPVSVQCSPPHQVTPGSMQRSWARQQALKALEPAPSIQSGDTEARFRADAATRRAGDLLRSTRSVRSASAAPTRRMVTLGGGKGGVITSRSQAARLADPFRPTRVEQPRPAKLVPPYTSRVGGPQRGSYARSAYAPLPNPAAPELVSPSRREAFPFGSRVVQRLHQVNPNVRAGYYATHWDDPHLHQGPYHPHEVELVATTARLDDQDDDARMQEAEAEQQMGASGDIGEEQRSLRSSTSAAALGFGRRHEDYKQYVFHREAAPRLGGSLREPLQQGDVVGVEAPRGRVLLPLPEHVLQSLPADAQRQAQRQGLALAVPFHAARFVEADSRDAHKRGHANAASLGYGKGHRGFYKYLFDNREGREDLALFRANHCS